METFTKSLQVIFLNEMVKLLNEMPMNRLSSLIYSPIYSLLRVSGERKERIYQTDERLREIIGKNGINVDSTDAAGVLRFKTRNAALAICLIENLQDSCVVNDLNRHKVGSTYYYMFDLDRRYVNLRLYYYELRTNDNYQESIHIKPE